MPTPRTGRAAPWACVGAGVLAALGCGGQGGGGEPFVERRAAEVHRLGEPRAEHTLTRLAAAEERFLVAGGLGREGALSSAEIVRVTPRGSLVVLPVGRLAVARHGHTATLLDTGEVLVAGGAATAQLERFVPAAGAAAGGAFEGGDGEDLAAPRRHHVGVRLAEGRVLLAGGESDTGEALAATELYDPTAAIASRVQPGGALRVARRLATATVLGEGRVVIAGGLDGFGEPLGSIELYDPAADSFSLTAELGGAGRELSRPRAAHAAALLGDVEDERVLFAGGHGEAGLAVASIEVLEVASMTVRTVGSASGPPVYGQSATRLEGGDVFLAGGLTVLADSAGRPASVRETSFLPADLGAALDGSDLPLRLAGHRAERLLWDADGDERVLVAGGTDAEDVPSDVLLVLFPGTAAAAAADTLATAEMLNVALLAAGFQLIRRESTGQREVDLRVVEDPLLGTRVVGAIGSRPVALEIDAGSIAGEVAGRQVGWRISGRRIRGSHFRLTLEDDGAVGSMRSDDVRYRIRMRRRSTSEYTGSFKARGRTSTTPDESETSADVFRASFRLLIEGGATLPGSYLRVKDE